jgi:DNA replication ATP-dependent helicase Dna2
MPSLSKKSLSLFLRVGCERQFVLSLYTNTELKNNSMPPKQTGRTGLGLIGDAGYDYQADKVSELKAVFGDANVEINPKVKKGNRPEPLELGVYLPHLRPHQFIVEARYEVETRAFQEATGLTSIADSKGEKVDLSRAQPDLIQVLPPLSEGLSPFIDSVRNPYKMKVLPDGETSPLDAADTRLRLRIIDIKNTSEPGAHYFAEVVYYSMTLSAWLAENGLEDSFVVIAAPAVWPGSHDASNLAKQQAEWKRVLHTPTAAELFGALEDDLEIAPVEVFAPRLKRFFAEQLPSMLERNWQDLTWHVDYRCKGCEFLGYPWEEDGKPTISPLHCRPTAEVAGHLSRVVGLSRGASEHLRARNVTDVRALAMVGAEAPVFADHQGLRAKRGSFPHRATALESNAASRIPDSGGDALMPRWPALHVYVFLDYDLSTAITAIIGVQAFWSEPIAKDSGLTPQRRRWDLDNGEKELFIVDQPNLERERGEFLGFLRHLKGIFDWVLAQDKKDTEDGRRSNNTLENSSYQIYLWDEAQRKHLVRLIGRHLPYILADPQLRSLAWLFPPTELLQHPEYASRQSPITLVANVVNNTVAVPIPHYHRLTDVAFYYAGGEMAPPHPLYQEPMSDLIPAERIHEYWKHHGDWLKVQDRIRDTMRKKVLSLSYVVRQLENDLRDHLSRQAAPPLKRTEKALTGVAPQARLWSEYTKLNAAVESLDVHSTRSMPPAEREARLKSARLSRRLSGIEEEEAIKTINSSSKMNLTPAPDLFIYKMSPDSVEVNFKVGEFNLALSPESFPGFLDEKPYAHFKDMDFAKRHYWGRDTIEESRATGVQIEAIDRVGGYIALRGGPKNCILEMEQESQFKFDREVVLDKVHGDHLSKKVDLTVKGIGYPATAVADERLLEALGLMPNTQAPNSVPTPAAEFLWEAPRLHGELTGRNLVPVRKRLEEFFDNAGTPLDASQWEAWGACLSRRLMLIWGPPGTGKSRTLRAIILGAVANAAEGKKPLRLLITSNTYTAIDNVLFDVARELKALLPEKEKTVGILRIQSSSREEEPKQLADHPNVKNLVLRKDKPSPELKALRKQLVKPSAGDIVVIGCPPQQLHNLAIAGRSRKEPAHTVCPWFDLVLIDEASQMDVAMSTLVLSKIAPGGSCVVAGDDLQLPPIHKADPPKDLEHIVGSAYNYFRRYHGIEPSPLNVNYRSNDPIVRLTRIAGYSAKLTSHSPDLKLNILKLKPLPTDKPADWPGGLFWTPDWVRILDPDYPAACFLYDDNLSSQVNDFEADAVASLIWLLNGRLANELENERKPDGSPKTGSTEPYDEQGFWGKAVGVVTPHKAQMAKVNRRLQEIFPEHSSEGIRAAIDTVERFQGQQRDVIVASFGLGDPDIISTEDEFLYNLNRFNVLTSRPRAKLIVFMTWSLLEHLSNDLEVLEESRLLKQFADSFCTDQESVRLGFVKNGVEVARPGLLRRAGF